MGASRHFTKLWLVGYETCMHSKVSYTQNEYLQQLWFAFLRLNVIKSNYSDKWTNTPHWKEDRRPEHP